MATQAHPNPAGTRRSIRWQVYIPLTIIIVMTFALTTLVVVRQVVAEEEDSVAQSHAAFADGRIALMGSYVDTLSAAATAITVMPERAVYQNTSSLTLMRTTLPLLDELVRLDTQGGLILAIPSDASLLQTDYTQTEWFVKAGAATPYVSEMSLDENEQAFVITASRTLDGGTYALRLDVEAVLEIFVSAELAEGGVSYVVDGSGRLIAHPERNLMIAGTSIHDAGYFERIASSQDFTFLGEVQNFQGKQVVASTAPLPFEDWRLVTEVPVAEAYTTSTTATRLLIAAAVGITVVAGLSLAVLLGRFVFGPLQSVSAATQQIAAGNFAARLQLPVRGEMAALQASFNQMAADLQRREERIRAQNEALSAANDELREANRLKDEFLATMSHELRTPLNSISGYANIMLAGMGVTVEGRVRSMVQQIATNSERLTDLITNMLDFSRLQATRVTLHPATLNIHDLLDKWRGGMEILAEQKGLEFSLAAEPGMPMEIQADHDALTKIVMNLLSNAIKFTHEGTVQGRFARQGDRIIFTVKDTGIGIAPHAQQYIFEEFRQVDGSATREYGGTGLGLAIVQRLVRLMEGTIRVESTLGEGSTFTVSLPLIDVPQTAPTGKVST